MAGHVVDEAAVDAVLTASRTLVAVATQSLGAAAEETTIAQYRALVVLETSAALAAYAKRHPRSWAALKPVFETTLGARIGGQETSLPVLALELTGSIGDAGTSSAA